MSDISAWSSTAASNKGSAPNGAPEGCAPSVVNDIMREMMAATRRFYENIEWRDFGHTVTYATATTFTIAGDVTATYTANRPIRCTDASTLYGYISGSSYSSPNTTVTVVLDSGSLSASLASVALGFDPDTKPIHVNSVRNALSTTTAASTYAVLAGSTGQDFNASKFLAAEGAATVGGYSFTADGGQDTGMFSPSDGLLDFYCNAVKVLSLTSSSGATSFPLSVGNGTSGTQAVNFSQVLGLGQTWQDVTASRALSTTYTNSTGRPILLSISGPNNTSNTAGTLTVNGVVIAYSGGSTQSGGYVNNQTYTAIVPNGGTYSLSAPVKPTVWAELR